MRAITTAIVAAIALTVTAYADPPLPKAKPTPSSLVCRPIKLFIPPNATEPPFIITSRDIIASFSRIRGIPAIALNDEIRAYTTPDFDLFIFITKGCVTAVGPAPHGVLKIMLSKLYTEASYDPPQIKAPGSHPQPA